ncbi:MAG: M20/M25/M40 family metallo-hydrolase [Longimicrobiales bacterium]
MRVRAHFTWGALTLTLAVAGSNAAGQEPVDRATIEKIRAEGLQRSQVLAMFNQLTNVFGPRLTGSPAHKTAADWSRQQLERWGLANPRLEPFEFGRGWTLEKLTLELKAPRYLPLFGYPEAWTPSTRGSFSGTPIYVGDKTLAELTALGDRLKDAIVLLLPPQTAFIKQDRAQPSASEERVRIGQPPSPRNDGKTPTRELVQALQQAGAGVILRPNMGEHGTIFVLGSRNTANDAVPSIVLMPEHYNMIVQLALAGAAPRVTVELRTRYHEQDGNTYNVLAELPGSDPQLKDEIVLIGAHLDSWHSSPGATDNADGSATVLEAMRILKAIGARPKRTIRVALWSGEEQGLLGSRAHAQKLYEGEVNAAARGKFYAYFNDDPGSGKIYGWYLQKNDALKPIFDAWLAPLKDLGAVRNVTDSIGNTDHLSFTRLGLPGFTAIKDYVDYDVRTHHTNVDYFERVKEEDLKQSAIVMAVFAWQAANRAARLPAPIMQ